MSESDRPVAHPEIVLREEFDDWAVLFNPDTADAVGINPLGVAVWKLLDGRHSIAGISLEIEEQFANVPEAAPEEIRAFVSDLADHGFVGYELEDVGT